MIFFNKMLKVYPPGQDRDGCLFLIFRLACQIHQGLYLLHGLLHAIAAAIEENDIAFAHFGKILYRLGPHMLKRIHILCRGWPVSSRAAASLIPLGHLLPGITPRSFAAQPGCLFLRLGGYLNGIPFGLGGLGLGDQQGLSFMVSSSAAALRLLLATTLLIESMIAWSKVISLICRSSR